jgi:multidrug efflux pump
MNLSAAFIRRPVATTLLSAAVALAGLAAFPFLPVSPLPQVDFPTISVNAGLPGADPETMASSVATPLERQLGRIAGLSEMTSSSSLGNTSITLQFDLGRDIDAAAREVQAAINAARGSLPAGLPNNPTYRKVNPADAPVLILALTSDTVPVSRIYDAASSVLAQKIAQIDGVGQVTVGGSSLPAVRVELNPAALIGRGLGLEDVRSALAAANVNRPKGTLATGATSVTLDTNDQLLGAEPYRSLVVRYQGGAVQLGDVARVEDSVENLQASGVSGSRPAVVVVIFREPGANIIATVDRVRAELRLLAAS